LQLGPCAYGSGKRGCRWITIDTSRVSLELARPRVRVRDILIVYWLIHLMLGLRELKSPERTCEDIRHSFVYERVPQIKLKSLANNAQIDIIWDR
jgi:adenine-specific DNA-methyltransferase